MENLNLKKGDDLEEAIENIQKILAIQNPSLKEADFTIKRKKIILPGGVRKEVDLYIEVDPGDDMKSIFIFECKNWEKPVNPGEITIFNKKIEETNATTGFFLAKSFSKYAIQEAKKYPRIKLLHVEDNYIYTEYFPKINLYDQGIIVAGIKCVQKGAKEVEEKLRNLDPNVPVYFQGEKTDIKTLIRYVLSPQIIFEKMSTQTTEEGYYKYEHEKEFTFTAQQFIVDNIEIERAKIKINFEITICKPTSVTKFKIPNKGQYLKLTFKTADGKTSEFTLAKGEKSNIFMTKIEEKN